MERRSETCTVLFQNKINLRYYVSGWFYYINNMCFFKGILLGFIKIFKISLEFRSSSKKRKSRDCVIELDYSGRKIR